MSSRTQSRTEIPRVKPNEVEAASGALKKHLDYMVPEMRLMLVRESGVKSTPITCPDDIEKFVEPMKHYDSEHFVSFHLDAKNCVVGYQLVSKGSLSEALVHPREVFKTAFLANSYAILVAHNHPTGSLTPSAEDLSITRTLIQAGELLGIKLVDHFIVGASGFSSLRETYPYLWP
jgi:DNA repair protein RadC